MYFRSGFYGLTSGMPERDIRIAASLMASNFRTGSKQSNQKLTNCYQARLKYHRQFAFQFPATISVFPYG